MIQMYKWFRYLQSLITSGLMSSCDFIFQSATPPSPLLSNFQGSKTESLTLCAYKSPSLMKSLYPGPGHINFNLEHYNNLLFRGPPLFLYSLIHWDTVTIQIFLKCHLIMLLTCWQTLMTHVQLLNLKRCI